MSRAEAPPDLFVGDALSGVELGEALIDSREKDEALDCIIDARVCRKVAKGFENALFG